MIKNAKLSQLFATEMAWSLHKCGVLGKLRGKGKPATEVLRFLLDVMQMGTSDKGWPMEPQKSVPGGMEWVKGS